MLIVGLQLKHGIKMLRQELSQGQTVSMSIYAIMYSKRKTRFPFLFVV